MRAIINQAGELIIATDDPTKGYALLRWMDENIYRIKNMEAETQVGTYTRLTIPYELPQKEKKKK